MYQLPLTRSVLIPYTRYSEIAEAISTLCNKLSGMVLFAWQEGTQDFMKGDGKHGYSNQVA
jgi:hypothetical protein